LKVPNTALRYKPPMTPEDLLALYRQYGIAGSDRPQASADSAMAAAQPGAQAGVAEQNQPRTPKTDTAVVWRRHKDNSIEPVKISLGITDHAYTQITGVLNGELKEGDELIIRSVLPKNQTLGNLRR
jgi:hypothetical protein